MRSHYDEITGRGAEVVAVGTGDQRYAQAFVEEMQVPFPVLVDDEGAAAEAASVRRVGPVSLLLNPKAMKGARRAHRAGHRVKSPGKRVNQLGATFVVGPGPKVRYEHFDANTADHAPMEEVLDALAAPVS